MGRVRDVVCWLGSLFGMVSLDKVLSDTKAFHGSVISCGFFFTLELFRTKSAMMLVLFATI